MKKYISAALLCCLFTSCGLYNDFETPVTEVESIAGKDIEVPDTAAVELPGWREIFTDTILQGHIERALIANSDMRIAQMNVQKAEHNLKTAKLSFIPNFNIGVNGDVTKAGSKTPDYNYSIPLKASWEVDIFGKLRNAKEQAKASLEQTKEYELMVKSQLIAGVAANYYSLLLADRQLEIIERSYDLTYDTYKAIYALKQVGMQTEAAVLQSSAALKELEIAKIAANSHKATIENNLSLLLNLPPITISRGKLELITPSNAIAESISMVALSNRSDVRNAEYQLANSFYGISYARSMMYPSINITATGMLNGGTTINPALFVINALGSITQPLFMAGRNKANLEIAKLTYEQDKLAFEKALLTAGKEVNDALYARYDAQATETVSTNLVKELERAVLVAQALMENGQANYLEVLSAQGSLLKAEQTLATSYYDLIFSEINLYKALGGGTK